MLSGLKPEEVDSLEYLSTIPKEELRGIMKAFRDFKAINRFMRWLILGTVGLFVGAAALGDSISKIIAWFRSPT